MRFQQYLGSRIESARRAHVITMIKHSNRASLITHMRLECRLYGKVAAVSILVLRWACCQPL